MIDWVFLDVGNVLYNDDPQNFLGYKHAYEAIRAHHPDYTFGQMLKQREELAVQGKDFILREILRSFLPQLEADAFFQSLRSFLIETYDRNNRVSPGAVETLENLKSRWKLGIIANQPPECRASLERRGLLGYFDVVGISDELSLHKPDVRFFQWAIRQTGCDPRRSVMVGDRRDNDIGPAQSVSMKTVLVSWPDFDSKGWTGDEPLAIEFLESCSRVSLFSAVPVGPEPHRVVSSLWDLPAAIASLADGANS